MNREPFADMTEYAAALELRPTPRTNAMRNEVAGEPTSLIQMTDFARTLERELAEAIEQQNGLAALVGTIRQMLPLPLRNVSDLTPPEHSREIGEAIDAIREQRDRLVEAALFLADVAEKNTDDTDLWNQAIDKVRALAARDGKENV